LNLDSESGGVQQDQNTETYLLTNKGLEKLDVKKEIGMEDEDEASQNKNANQNNKTEFGNNTMSSKPPFDAREMSRMKARNTTNQSFNNSQANVYNQSMNNSFDSLAHPSTTTHANTQAQQQQNSYVNINIQLNELIEKILEDDPNDPDFDEDRSLVDYSNPMLY
jgi:hypothetical protein